LNILHYILFDPGEPGTMSQLRGMPCWGGKEGGGRMPPGYIWGK